jgi:hypothetical protein
MNDHVVQFSAHDGTSVVALIHMIDFLSKNPRRGTAVFNIRNREEDVSGLHGAQTCATFTMHCLSSLIFYVLPEQIPTTPMDQRDIDVPQLRGAGPGGYFSQLPSFILTPITIPIRPFLFRSTSYDGVLKHFCSAPHIHADALSQDARDRDVIRSDMDYSVYAAPRTRHVSAFRMVLATSIKALVVACRV